MLNKIVWSLRQLLPLSYTTTYKENGQWHACHWRMWFGRCFSVNDRVLS